MKIIYTRKAKADLQGIREYYGPLSPQALRHITSDIISLVNDLPHSIAKGRITPHAEVWEKITPRYGYVIPYYINGGGLPP